MEILAKAIPTLLMHVFAPMLGVCLAAWFAVRLVSAISGKRHSCRFTSALSGSGGSAASPRRRLGKAVWAGLFALAVTCTSLVGKNTNGVQNLPPRPMLQLPAPQSPVPSIFDYPRTVTEARAAAGIALVGVGTNETFAFDPPTNAAVCDDWRTYGSATRWMHVSPTNFAFPFGGTNVSAFTFVPGGVMYVTGGGQAAASNSLAPFRAKMGIAPERLWSGIGVTSRLWTATSPSNTFLATWQGAFLNRSTNNPVDVQLELFPDGGFDCRYDLSRLPPDADLSSVRVGAASGGFGETYSVPHRSLTSARWRPVAPEDATDPDRDSDGVTTVDELFFLGTDPGNPDSDFDGLPDGQELALGLDPLDPYSNGGPHSDGFAVALGNEDPLASPPDSSCTIYEQIVYSGTTNGTASVPVSTPASAVLEVSASGTGTGDLIVGGSVLPLVGDAPTVRLPVPRGLRHRVRLRRRTGALSVSLDAADYAIGEMPGLMEGDPTGWICFPRVTPDPTVACIHDLAERKVTVRIDPGTGAAGLSCLWWGTSAVAASNHADGLSATLTGNFDAHGTARVMYTLVHPRWLLGMGSCWQAVRFCPRPADADDEPEDEPDEGFWPDDPHADLWDGGEEDGRSGCGCCQSCALAGGDGGDGGTEECHHHDDEAPPAVSGLVPGANPPTTCPVHNCPCSECEDLHGDAAPRTVTVPASTHVLTIGRNPSVDAVALTIPEGAANCCPCPDHWTNCVGVAYRSPHLSVKDDGGFPFHRSETNCTVYVTGVSPTYAAAGAPLAFATNGAISVRRDYAVLGVDIDTPDGTAGMLNALAPAFGIPATVCTNVDRAAGLDLVTRVRLAAGAVTLAAGGGAFQAWLDRSNQGRPPLLLVDGTARPTLTMSLAKWRTLANLTGDEDEARTRILLTSAAPGARTLTFSFTAGGLLTDSVTQNITFIDPLLLADTDGDWTLGSGDVADALVGSAFRFWKNEDRNKGDYVGQFSDISPNADDLQVNGRLDLVNLFPVRVDLKPLVDAWGNATFRLRAPAGVLRFCSVDVPPDAAWSFQTNDVYTAPSGQRELVSAAHLTSVTTAGVEIAPSDILRAGNAPGVLAFEAAGDVYAENALEIYVEMNGTTVFSHKLPLSISSVRNMYRWRNIRGVCGDLGGETDSVGEPSNRPDAECDGRHFVFVHGYNVNAAAAREWSDAMFKRLWLAGSRSMFTAVDWYGDSSQFASLFHGDVSPDYYANVVHAFASASNLVETVAALPGTNKVMLAHSLGNMLVSSAAKDCGLQYNRYYMLNAAVPMEAYDETEFLQNMVDSAWNGVPLNYRASDWNKLFQAETNDFRYSLSWRGRFVGITNAVNCYSTTEDVLENATGLNYGEAWAQQELFKGTAVWQGLNAVPFLGLDVACEGGWGINAFYALNPALYTPGYGFHSSVMDDITRKDAIEHPLFTPFRSEAENMHSTNLFTIANETYRNQLRAKFLADAIPATSFAAGANPVSTNTISGNINYEDCKSGDWPRRNKRWEHSDIKNVALFFNWKLFRRIISNHGGNSNEQQQNPE